LNSKIEWSLIETQIKVKAKALEHAGTVQRSRQNRQFHAFRLERSV
jgi:hypothetical protein